MKRSLLLAALFTLAACGGSAPTQTGPTTTVDHSKVLADHEIPDLAAQLVTIDGYSYADPPAREVTQSLVALHELEQRADRPDLFAAVSLHGVVADDRTQNRSHTSSGGSEVGYLALYEFRFAPPAGLETDASYFANGFEKKPAAPERLTLSATQVFKFQNPSSPDSRYVYLWLRHGVQGQFDGADAEPMERWLASYLAAPALSPNESEELAEHLFPVTGFVYVNAPQYNDLESALVAAFGSVPHSIHKVADSSGSIGTLSLAQPTSPTQADQAAARFFAAAGLPLNAAEHQVIGRLPVSIYTSDAGTFYVWEADGTVAMYGSNTEPAGATFIRGLLDAWTAND